ncbi:MAG: SET domain-containing protein [Gemmatimonadales bacterium]
MPAFEIRRSRIQGRGGFATRRIKRGERVGEYTGERISQGEADRRYDDDAMARHHTFLFAVSARTVIDAAAGGNDTRYINHSCAPNCDAVIERGRVFIDARKPIFEGEELFYDYSYEREKDAGPDAESQYPCWCGAPKCRGTILMPKKRVRSKVRRAKRSRTRGARKTRETKRQTKRQTKGQTKGRTQHQRTRQAKRPAARRRGAAR